MIKYSTHSEGYRKIYSIYKESNELGLLRILRKPDNTLSIQTPYYMLSKYISHTQGIELELFQKLLNISQGKSTMIEYCFAYEAIIGNPGDSKLVYIITERLGSIIEARDIDVVQVYLVYIYISGYF